MENKELPQETYKIYNYRHTNILFIREKFKALGLWVQDLSRMHIPTPEEMAELERQQREQAEMMQRLHFEHQELNGITGEFSEDPDTALRNQSAQRGGSVSYNFISSPTAAHPTENASADDTDENPYANLAISRNAPCPCGSGLKYKQCHGKI